VAREATAEPKAAKRVTHLPLLATTPGDINRLSRELETIDDSLLELETRLGADKLKLPRTSQLLDQLVELNKLNLLHKTDRRLLKQFLAAVKQQAPVMHMSFSADPSAIFLEKLVTWLRREIHPQVLLTIGLQPTLGAGCIVRTTNRQFDFSLRQDFAKHRDLLIDKLRHEPEGKPA
jgi:F0F1-type ATP synthase delta subunit